MKKYLFILSCLFVSVSGCSSEMARRSTYETLENLRMQQCAGDLLNDCGGRQSYNDYQRQRDEALQKDNKQAF